MCRAMPFSAHALKQILWRWCYGEKQIEMWIIVVCTLIDNKYASLLFPGHFLPRCFRLLNESANVYETAYKYLFCITQRVSPSMLFRGKFSLEFKAMLQKLISLATLHGTMMNKKPFKLQKGCHMFATFFANCNAHNNKQYGGNLPWAKDEFWLAHSGKIELQVAEGMLHKSNLSRNVSKSRGSFYFSCNSQRNNCNCKMGCYTWIFSCNLQRTKRCVASCKKNCFVQHGL